MKEVRLRVEPLTRKEQAKRELRMYETIRDGLIKINSGNPFLTNCIENARYRINH